MTDTKYLYQYFLEKSISEEEKKNKLKKTDKISLKPQKASQTRRMVEDVVYE